ncbi:putative tetratricopeptide repeat domain-containing protein [Rosellinia necatrix]|uniref:Putative tetratricopeptide repeat domain-containing protein n=1 Tax=Rosellinia necatrix TaxID=77044 RepID=A0A1W2TM22_ROSNE|nr:putative tetratricopeptide repeat domain-containing protein [Rosellinia necatrix]
MRNRLDEASSKSESRGQEPSTSLSQPSLSLSNVIELRPDDELKIESSIIAVPGYCTYPVQQWAVNQELEQAALPIHSVSHLHMYTYNPPFGLPDDFSWDSFLKTGSDLAEDLAQLATEFPHRPIVLIAHSLGGLLLKKALLLAHQNLQDPRFKLVLDCLSGILFLGTPHSGVTDESTLLRHNQVLFGCAKIALQKQSSKLPRHDVFQLANLAATFEQITNIPVLSVYELADRSSSVHKLFGKKTKVLVDEALATISSDTERLLGVHLAHSELCKLPLLKDQTYSAREFLRSLFTEMAANPHLPRATIPSPIAGPNKKDPLNPLNLPRMDPFKLLKASSSGPVERTGPDAFGAELSHRYKPQSSLISSMNSKRLLEDRNPRLPCFSVPMPPNPNFVGRSDLFSQIDDALLTPRPDAGHTQPARTFALCGMGGIGKTDTAIEYAHSRKDKFAAVFWVDSGSTSQITSGFAQIAMQLEIVDSKEEQDLELCVRMATTWLSNPRSADKEDNMWLLILDNADQLSIVTSYLPSSTSGAILITSRDPFARDYLFSMGTGVDMESLSTTESMTLLQKLVPHLTKSPTTQEQNASAALAKKLDGLPLAVVQTAGFIRRRLLSVEEFVDMFGIVNRYGEVRDISSPYQENRYGYTLATAYNFQGLSEKAMKLLNQIAFMNPDHIQEDIFTNPALDKTLRWKVSEFESARFELLTSSLIKRDIEKRELQVHRIVQSEIRYRLHSTRRYQIFQDVVSLLAAKWPRGDLLSQARERWPLCEPLVPHLEQFFMTYLDYSEEWKEFEVFVLFPKLLNESGLYLRERDFSHEGIKYLELALELCTQASITQEPLLSDMHLTIGTLYNGVNDFQSCFRHNAICLSIRQSLDGDFDNAQQRLAFAYSQMGVGYMGVKKFAMATEYFKQSVELLKSVDAHVEEYCFPVCNLGLAYWIQGELSQADHVLTDYRSQRDKLGDKLDRISYKNARLFHALGNVKAAKAAQSETDGKDEEAKKLWNESLEIHLETLKQYEQALGISNRRVADACHKLAEHYMRRDMHAEAEEKFDRALTIYGDFPWYKRESARSSFLRGVHLVSMGGEDNLEQGKRWIHRAEVLRKEILPNEPPKELEPKDFDSLICFWSI